jgi:hypothetical protein
MKIDISGPQGNAFELMSIAERIGRQLNIPSGKIEEIRRKMTSGDYDNLLKVFHREYGSVVELYDAGKRIVFIRRKSGVTPL